MLLADRINVPNKANKIAIFDNLDVRKNFVDRNGYRYPKLAVIPNYGENDYLDQCRDLKFF